LDEEIPVQTDRFNLVYLIFLLNGVGVLLPWNTFLTIGYDVRLIYNFIRKIFLQYFVNYKLNGTDQNTEFRRNFFNYLTAAAQIPNLSLSLLNLFVVIKGGLHKRIYLSLMIIALVCLITIVFVFVDSLGCLFFFKIKFFIFKGLSTFSFLQLLQL
jgi:solute carrier family 29 (equilibrative nucleoside transporter), member 1/2/3